MATDKKEDVREGVAQHKPQMLCGDRVSPTRVGQSEFRHVPGLPEVPPPCAQTRVRTVYFPSAYQHFSLGKEAKGRRAALTEAAGAKGGGEGTRHPRRLQGPVAGEGGREGSTRAPASSGSNPRGQSHQTAGDSRPRVRAPALPLSCRRLHNQSGREGPPDRTFPGGCRATTHLLEGAGEEVDERQPEHQGEHPALPQEPAPHHGRQVHHAGADAGHGGRGAERGRPGARAAWPLRDPLPHRSRRAPAPRAPARPPPSSPRGHHT